MNKNTITMLRKTFEECINNEECVEFWYARDLQQLLGYSKWENFYNAIEKAKISCKKSGHHTTDHFPDIRKTILMPKGATKEIQDLRLTRYACYLIAQNGDPRK
jgi:DNA-damage-inducible protein D